MGYWEERARELEKRLQDGANGTADAARRAIGSAYRELDREIAKLSDILGADGAAPPPPSALYERRRRLRAVKRSIDREFRAAARTMETALGSELRGVMGEAYYRTIFDFQRGTGFAFSFTQIPKRAIGAALADGWLGSSYSKRVWKNAEAAASAAKDIIQTGLLTGASTERMAAELRGRMGADWRKAERLIRTEVNFHSNIGEMAAYEESGVEEYEFLATLDLRTSDICQEHDGKRYPLSEAVVGENWPPLHPNCRSTTVAVIEGFEERLGERAAKDKDGKNIRVPADMRYEDWKRKFVDGDGLQSGGNGGIMESGSGRMIDDRAAGGLRRSPFNILSDEEIEYLKGEIRAIGADERVFAFNEGTNTGYLDDDDVILVRYNVFPGTDSIHPRDLMSERAVLAHEYYGHRAYRGTTIKPQSWNDEFRASYSAAKNTPNLSDKDRRYLILDAMERAKEAGVAIKLNDYMRSVLYGY